MLPPDLPPRGSAVSLVVTAQLIGATRFVTVSTAMNLLVAEPTM